MLAGLDRHSPGPRATQLIADGSTAPLLYGELLTLLLAA